MESLNLAFSVGMRKYMLCEQCPLLAFNQLCVAVANTTISNRAPEKTAGGNAGSQRARAEEDAQVWRTIDAALARLPREHREALVNSIGVLGVLILFENFLLDAYGYLHNIRSIMIESLLSVLVDIISNY